jgi:hypothetical protein
MLTAGGRKFSDAAPKVPQHRMVPTHDDEAEHTTFMHIR